MTGFTFNPALGASTAAFVGAGLVSGAAGGLVSGLVSEGVDVAKGGCFDTEEVLQSFVVSAALGGIGGKLTSLRNPDDIIGPMADQLRIENGIINAAFGSLGESFNVMQDAYSGSTDCD